MLAGSLENWLPHFRGVEEQVVDAVKAVWPSCIGPLQTKKDMMTHEDHITEHLVYALIQSKSVPGRIEYQYPLLIKDIDGNVSMSSKIDFVVTIGDDEDVYLACECKRLNIPYQARTKGLASEYVEEGLMRFITGQYSNGLPVAMMLGYVMDARIDQARCGVMRAMRQRATSIGLLSERETPIVEDLLLRFHTTHSCTPGHVIEVAHTFLAWPEHH